MALIVVEAVSAVIESPAVDDRMRISTGGKCGFDASAPLLTRASPMHFSGAKRGLATLLNLVKLVGPSSTLAQELSPCFTQSAAAPSIRLRVFVSGSTPVSVARRGC